MAGVCAHLGAVGCYLLFDADCGLFFKCDGENMMSGFLQALKCERQKLLLRIEKAKRAEQIAKDVLDEVNRQIYLIERELWWERFIVYCNTPCWKFRIK